MPEIDTMLYASHFFFKRQTLISLKIQGMGRTNFCLGYTGVITEMTNAYEVWLLPYIGEDITQVALERVEELGNRRPRAEVLAPLFSGCGYLGAFTLPL